MRRSFYLFIFLFPFIGISKGLYPKPKSPCTLTADCPPPVTLIEGMKYDTSVTGAPKITSNNGGAVSITWLEVYQKGDCKNHADQVTRLFTVRNASGEEVRCNQNITIKHLTVNDVYFPSDTTVDYPDSLTTLTNTLLTIPKSFGSLKLTYTDTRVSQNCNIPVRIRRQWLLEDICSGQTKNATTFMNVHKFYNEFKQIIKKTDAVCADDGFITLTPVGEFTPYKYKWNSGDSLPSIFNKAAGSYSLTVTDGFGCTVSQVYDLVSMSQRADIGGRISTDDGIRVIPDSLVFENESLISKLCISQASGLHYGFTLKTRKTGQYNYYLVRNTGPLDGITTKDIVLIQRHILGITKFTDTLQYIAADVNNNFNITASDISEIRRLILGVKANFTYVKPWYFLRKDWRAVAKPNKPISDIEFKGVNVPNFPLTNVDIFVLKMADIDLSYNGLQNNQLESRVKSDEVKLDLHTGIIINNEKWIPVYLKSTKDLYGIQFKLRDISNQSLKLLNNQLDESFIFAKDNAVTVSWSTGTALQWNQDQPLFYIQSSNAEQIKEDTELSAEWYDSELNVYGLKISSEDQSNTTSSTFFFPNPTNDRIHFNFNFAKLEVKLYNPEGKLILSRTLHSNQELNLQNLSTGIYILNCTRENGSNLSELLEIK